MKPEDFGKVVGQAIGEALEPLHRRLDALDRANGKTFIPSHRAGKGYSKGATVSHDGGYWQATTATSATPGGAGWARLMTHTTTGYYTDQQR